MDNIEQLIILVFMLMTLIQMFWIKNSIPVEHVEKLLNKAQGIADETPSEIDNQFLGLVRNFWTWYQTRNTPAPDDNEDLEATNPIPDGEIEAQMASEKYEAEKKRPS